MTEPIHDKIKRSHHAAEDLYHRPVLLGCETGPGNTSVFRDVSDDFGTPFIHDYLSHNAKELRSLPKDDPAMLAKVLDHLYLPAHNKAGNLKKLRATALLKEFGERKEVKKELKGFRLEADYAGFKNAWQKRDYTVIVTVADKIPNNILKEDPKLFTWYDQVVGRKGGKQCL